MGKTILTSFLLVLAVFTYSDMKAQFVTNGGAFSSGSDCYTLTIDAPGQAGSIFSNSTINLNNDFSLEGQLNFGEKDLQGADGFVFVFTTSNTALGSGGGDLGFVGISPSLGWEIDDYFNGGYGDTNPDHMAIMRDGDVVHFSPNNLVGPITIPNMEDGQGHCFEIEWDAGDQTFEASLDGNDISYTGDIVNDIFGGNPDVYFGFTSATGGLSNLHEICFDAPAIEPMEDITICPCESVQLQADQSGDAYTWDPDPSLSDTDISNPNVDPCETTTYIVEVEFNCFPSQDDEVTVYIENFIDTIYSFSETCDIDEVGTIEELVFNPTGCDIYNIETISLYDHLPNDTIFYYFETCFPEDTGTIIIQTEDAFDCELVEVEIISLYEHLPNDTLFIFLESCFPADTGVFYTTEADNFDCDQVIVETITLYEHALFDTIYNFFETCFPQDTGLVVYTETDGFGCELIFADYTSLYEHLPNDTSFVLLETCYPQDTGYFINNYNDFWGCDSVVIEQINLYEHLPNDTSYTFLQSCNPLDTGLQIINGLDQFGCDSISVQLTSLFDPLPIDTIYVFSYSCNLLDTGTFINTYQNQFNCDSTVIHQIDLYDHLPNDTTLLVNYTCDQNMIGETINQVQDQFGCDSIVVAQTLLYDPLPLDTSYIQYYSCAPSDTGSVTQYFINQFGCDSILIETTSLFDNAIHDTTFVYLESCDLHETGIVVDQLYDVNGCDSIVAFVTNLYPHLPQDTTRLNYLSCSESDTGLMVLNLVDSYGCDSLVYEFTSLSSQNSGFVYLSEVEEILLGDYFKLYASTDFTDEEILNISWIGDNITSCSDCLEQEIQALNSSVYSIEITTVDGCVFYDEVFVNVKEVIGELLIPNVFSPNGDGVNEYFYLNKTFGYRENEKSLLIFDRWGEQVFTNTSYMLGEELEGWDGKLNGEYLSAGVYVFVLEVKLTTGETHYISGDVTLIR